MMKMIGTARKINAILLNMKTNQPKLVHMCGYELATNHQNFTEIHLAYMKISQKVLGGLLFLTGTVVIVSTDMVVSCFAVHHLHHKIVRSK